MFFQGSVLQVDGGNDTSDEEDEYDDDDNDDNDDDEAEDKDDAPNDVEEVSDWWQIKLMPTTMLSFQLHFSNIKWK